MTARIQKTTASCSLWYLFVTVVVLTTSHGAQASRPFRLTPTCSTLPPPPPSTQKFARRTAFVRHTSALCVRGGTAGGAEESSLLNDKDEADSNHQNASVSLSSSDQTDQTTNEDDEMPPLLEETTEKESELSHTSAVDGEECLEEDKSPIEKDTDDETTTTTSEKADESSDVDSPSVSDNDDKESNLVETEFTQVPEPDIVTETTDALDDEKVDERLTTATVPAVFETTTTTVLEEEGPAEVNTQDEDEELEQEETVVEAAVEPEPRIDPATLTRDQVEEIVQQAVALRAAGKESHDTSDFEAASLQFGAAADLLESIVSHWTDWIDEFATCRLHEALCRLKMQDHSGAMDACTNVLNLQQGEESTVSVAPALRARAYHRRAKAQLELGKNAAALEDARAAAFLGDRKAVALYGKLMRGSSSMSLSDENSSSDLAASSALFESLLSKSSGMDMMNEPSSSGGNSMASPPPFSMPDLMGQMMGAGGGLGSGGNLAKSVLTSLSKRLEDEATQDQICGYLQKASAPQLQQMAGMAGFPLKDGQATTLANFCQKVTPRTIGRTVRNTKRAVYVVQLIRKVYKVLVKYRSLLVIITLLAWIKSALLRPIPINKAAARRAAKEAAKAAAQAAANHAASLV